MRRSSTAGRGTWIVGAPVIVLAAAFVSGCDTSKLADAVTNPSKSGDASSETGNNAEAPANPAEPTREVAKAGVGKKGQSLKDHEGMVVTPIKQYFLVPQKVAFEIEIPRAIALYKQLEGDGKGPQSQEEFMERIIKFNRINLPELPAGDRYVYDVEKEQLMVEHPASRSRPN